MIQIISYKSQTSSHQLTEFFEIDKQKTPRPSDNTSKELKVVKSIVKAYLDYYPETRNSDNLLIEKIHSCNPHYKKIPIESITRMRRHIQNDLGLFLPTDKKVLQRRALRSETFRKYFRGGTQC